MTPETINSLNYYLSPLESQVREYLSRVKPDARHSPKSSTEKLSYSLRFLVTNALSVPKGSSHSVSKRPANYSPASKFYNPNLSYRVTIQQAYKSLIALGYLEETKQGYRIPSHLRNDGLRQDKSEQTQYRATQKLFDLFPYDPEILPVFIPPSDVVDVIRVNIKSTNNDDADRRELPLKSVQSQVMVMTNNLAVINKILAKSWIDLELPNNGSLEEILSIVFGSNRTADGIEKTTRWVKEGRQILFRNRQLYRVFNDRELETGGRFYGGWWIGFPSVLRPFILIDGKRTVDLDYGSLHPSILYALQGLERPTDAYEGIALNVPSNKQDGARRVIKVAFNAMLNAKTKLNLKPDNLTDEDIALTGLSWPELKKAIAAKHSPIAHHFGTGVGLKLQKADSDIAEKVLLHFAVKDVPVLPIHDGFRMHWGYENELRDIMSKVFVETYGKDPKIDVTVRKRWDLDEEPEFHSPAESLENLWSCYLRANAFLSNYDRW